MLRDKREELIKYINQNKPYLDRNFQIYDMYTGNLLPYVLEVLKKTLSENYFKKIEARVVPINILERYIKKVSGAYENPPTRTANNETNQKVIDYYVKQFGFNKKMETADQYSHLFKGFALEPFVDKFPKLRVLPFDRFLVYSDNQIDPTSETVFIKILGKRLVNNVMQEVYYTFTDEEIDAFSADGKTYSPALEENSGVNPYSLIYFTYGNRAENELLPVQDTDIIAMSKLVSVFLSDLSGAILFTCFSIIYGIDLQMENAVMSPNALWSFKSDPNSDKVPTIGTIKPEADIAAVMNYIVSVFAIWLETKGIRVGSLGGISSGNLASGISKIIDEMDVFKVVKESISFFENDEKEFWHKMVNVHNNWIETKQVTGLPKMTEDFSVEIVFQEPQPKREKKDLIEEKKLEVEAKFKSRRKAIKELNPKMSDNELELELAEIEGENTEEVNPQDLIDGQV